MLKLTTQQAGRAPLGFRGIARPAFSDCLPREKVSSQPPRGFLFHGGLRPGYPGPSHNPSAGMTSGKTCRRHLRAGSVYQVPKMKGNEMTVNKERVRKLVDALRSREYAKGTKHLHRIIHGANGSRKDEWCCLGVASDVAAKNGLAVDRRTVELPDGTFTEEFGGLPTETLCRAVQEWYGFRYDNPVLVNSAGIEIPAASWNDDGEFSGEDEVDDPEPDFTQIADGFERTFLGE